MSEWNRIIDIESYDNCVKDTINYYLDKYNLTESEELSYHDKVFKLDMHPDDAREIRVFELRGYINE